MEKFNQKPLEALRFRLDALADSKVIPFWVARQIRNRREAKAPECARYCI